MATPLPRNRVSLVDAANVAAIVGGRVIAPASLSPACVCTDSREVEPGDVFVALVGEKHDAHAFLADVAARGAALVIVSRDVSVPAGVGAVKVGDSLAALGALGAWARSDAHAKALGPVIGITGSVGKTSTKQMCAAMLRALAGAHVVATEGNLNNLIGVPRTLLSLDEGTTHAVVEIGMNVPGEIARLCAIARPTVGLVTAVAEVHTEGVGSLEGVAREKGAMLTSLAPEGTAIFTADDAILAPYAEASKAKRKISFGKSEHADVRLVSREAHGAGQRARYVIAGRDGEVELGLHLLGEAAAKNAAGALALGWALAGEAGIDAAKRGLATIQPEPGRLAALPGPGGTIIVDDSYNASPRAVINAIDTATEIARTTSGRLVAVLGDMLELGALEADLHALVGEHVALAGVSLFVACGKRMRAAADEAREMGADLVLAVDDPMDAIAEVERFLIEGDVVVVKGSRGMRMERVVEALTARKEQAG
jgi:UDP-N-acetylmuramoyl-tripeptide--D-alanyl-D-alanine ligase